MKDGRTHLLHSAEHATDMETGAVVAVVLVQEVGAVDRWSVQYVAHSEDGFVIDIDCGGGKDDSQLGWVAELPKAEDWEYWVNAADRGRARKTPR